MKRDKIILGILIVIMAVFAVRGCSTVKQENRKQAQETIQTKKSKSEESKPEKSKQEKEKISGTGDAAVGEREIESKQETKENMSFEGMEISGYTKEVERVFECDAKDMVNKLRGWLDKNGYTGVTGVALCDTIIIVQSEGKYSVDCQLLIDDELGNGVQPEGKEKASVVAMDYYKNRSVYQFHP